MAKNIIIGNVYGYLRVLCEVLSFDKKHRKYVVCCEKCESKYVMYGENIARHGKSNAKGCKYCYHQSTSHGMSNHPCFKVWEGMIRRCNNEKHKAFKNYGGRGITICEEWERSPMEFIEWAVKNGWKKGLQIDRIDNYGGYFPSNCRFVTATENLNNSRANRHITINGKKFTISQASRAFALNYTTIRERLQRGWSDNESIRKPRVYRYRGN